MENLFWASQFHFKSLKVNDNMFLSVCFAPVYAESKLYSLKLLLSSSVSELYNQ